MARAPRSLLLLDPAPLRRSLNRISAGAGDRLSAEAATWIGALESGEIVSPSSPRRVVERRCYGPADRALSDAGFDIVDVSAGEAEVQIALDALDALGEGDHAEIILLMGPNAARPILRRVKDAGRQAIVFTEGRSAGDQADGSVSAEKLAALLLPEPEDEQVDREQVEAFARKVSSATNVPLLSPKAYAQLFACLAEEITDNGYDFRSTAQNVAERLTTLGRKVGRRQVVFVVKGLALKGHVFTAGESPHRLAEVFADQVRYLMDHVGMESDDATGRLLTAWLVDRTVPRNAAGARTTPAAKETENEKPVAASPAPATPPPVPARAAPTKSPSKSPAEPAATRTSGEPKPTTRRPEKRKRAKTPAAATPPKPPETQKPAETPTRAEPAAARTDSQHMRSAEQIKSEISARIAAAVEERRAAARARPAEQPPRRAPAKDAPEKQAEAPPPVPAARDDDAPLESSILAAIAQAVDVLVDSSGRTADERAAAVERELRGDPPPDVPPPVPDTVDTDDFLAELSDDDLVEETVTPQAEEPHVEPETDDPGDDIGDEIQRIIASYKRRDGK